MCRVIQRLGPLPALAPVSRPCDAADRLWIVDGTLVPVRDRRVGSSSRNYRFSANVQVIIDADTRLVIATAPPVPGTTQGWPRTARPSPSRATAPTSTARWWCRTTNAPTGLLPGEEADTAAHRKVRARVEHVSGRMKNYKILRDCRQRGDGLHHAVQAVALMHSPALAPRPEDCLHGP